MAPLGLGLSLLPKLYTLAALTVCPVRAAPHVEVLFSTDEPFYSENHNSVTLKNLMKNDKESTLTTEKSSTVFGVTTSRTEGAFHVNYETLTDQAGNQCIYIGRAYFTLRYSPAVFVSSDVRDMACTYDVTRAHEAQHVAIDLQAIEEYIPQIKMEMLVYLRSVGYQGWGPYRQSETANNAKQLTLKLKNASEPMIEKLREARRQRQRSIDTLENYRREAEKCPQDRPAIHEKFYSGLTPDVR
jgi:hypothetical protein